MSIYGNPGPVSWRTGWIWLLLFLPCLGLGQGVPAWDLVWSDEFELPDGSAPDPLVWTYDVGGGGWGNGELQYHTRNRRENARIEGGQLVIEARQELYKVRNQTWDYTSARLKTQGLKEWTYGRFEARIQIPAGQGLWPAFWMLGANYPTVGWPACGELDIMENIGREPSSIHGSAHGPGYSGANSHMRTYTLTDGTRFHERAHLFAIEWEPDQIRYSVDNRVYFTFTPANLSSTQSWVFDAPFFVVLNVAVGGLWPGPPDASTVFPQQMRVDYVRVYRRTTAPPPVLRITGVGERAAAVAWPISFPHARLQRAALPGNAWLDLPPTGRVVDQSFVLDVEPGFFRLRW